MKSTRIHANVTSLTVAALLLPVILQAQPKCSVLMDDVDEYTQVREVKITATEIAKGPRFEWHILNEHICLRLEWTNADGRPAVVFEGDPLLVKLENDSVLVLFSQETVVGRKEHDDEGNEFTRATYCYIVPKQDMLPLGEHWVQRIRIHFHEGSREFVATGDPDWQMGFWRSANCVRQTMALKPMPSMINGFGERLPEH
jgi:hypothetical protein